MQSNTNSSSWTRKITPIGVALLVTGLTSLFPARAGTPTSSNTVPIILVWDKPTPADPTLVYRVYYTTNITTPTNQWPLLTTITNPTSFSASSFGWTNYYLKPGVYFFTMTSSNLWYAAPFSAAAVTPPAPPLLNNLGLEAAQ